MTPESKIKKGQKNKENYHDYQVKKAMIVQ